MRRSPAGPVVDLAAHRFEHLSNSLDIGGRASGQHSQGSRLSRRDTPRYRSIDKTATCRVHTPGKFLHPCRPVVPMSTSSAPF